MQTIIEKKLKYYETVDIVEAAFLVCSKHRCISTKPIGNTKKSIFCFMNSEDLQKCIIDYIINDSVSAKSLAYTIRDLKNRLTKGR